jgi:hypothetical protein
VEWAVGDLVDIGMALGFRPDISLPAWSIPNTLPWCVQTAQDPFVETWQSSQDLLATSQSEYLNSRIFIQGPLQTIHLEDQYAAYGGLSDSMSALQTHQPNSFETESSGEVNGILGLLNSTTYESSGLNAEHKDFWRN